jgi:hypothetical protein
VEASRFQLEHHRDQEHRHEDDRGDQIADVQGLGQQVAPGFSQGGGHDLQYPEQQCDMRKFAHHETGRFRWRRPRRAVTG